MKTASTTLINFMENATSYVKADLYTFTLNSGTVLRYSGAPIPIVYQGVTWPLGPPIEDSGVKSTRGINASSVDITIFGGTGAWLVNGVDILNFIFGFGLDGATVRIDRAMCDTWANMAANGPIGLYNRFMGLFTEAKELGQSQAVITVQDPRSILQTPYPSEIFSVPCLNTLGDANCGVHLAGLTKNTTVTSAASQLVFDMALSAADGFYDLGSLTFTSGANAGIQRSIKTSAASGNTLTLTAPLPSIPAPGDAFSIAPGCALTLASCQSYDSPPAGVSAPAYPYTQRFRATPYVPPPTTGIPS